MRPIVSRETFFPFPAPDIVSRETPGMLQIPLNAIAADALHKDCA